MLRWTLLLCVSVFSSWALADYGGPTEDANLATSPSEDMPLPGMPVKDVRTSSIMDQLYHQYQAMEDGKSKGGSYVGPEPPSLSEQDLFQVRSEQVPPEFPYQSRLDWSSLLPHWVTHLPQVHLPSYFPGITFSTYINRPPTKLPTLPSPEEFMQNVMALIHEYIGTVGKKQQLLMEYVQCKCPRPAKCEAIYQELLKPPPRPSSVLLKPHHEAQESSPPPSESTAPFPVPQGAGIYASINTPTGPGPVIDIHTPTAPSASNTSPPSSEISEHGETFTSSEEALGSSDIDASVDIIEPTENQSFAVNSSGAAAGSSSITGVVSGVPSASNPGGSYSAISGGGAVAASAGGAIAGAGCTSGCPSAAFGAGSIAASAAGSTATSAVGSSGAVAGSGAFSASYAAAHGTGAASLSASHAASLATSGSESESAAVAAAAAHAFNVNHAPEGPEVQQTLAVSDVEETTEKLADDIV